MEPDTDARVRTAVIQSDLAWEDRSANLVRFAPTITAAAVQGARLVVLPEMFPTGFSPRTEVIEEPPDGPSSAFMVEQAIRHGIWLIGSVCMKVTRSDPASNVALVATPEGQIHRYAKRHLFSYAGEHERMSAGSESLVVDIHGVRVSVAICYDLRFANDFWDLAPDTDAYVVVANWPTARIEHWRALLIARAIENQAWVIGCNRVGTGGGLDYSGDSLVVDPNGVVRADGAGGQEMVLWADLDAAEVASVRARYPFLADRAPSSPASRQGPQAR